MDEGVELNINYRFTFASKYFQISLPFLVNIFNKHFQLVYFPVKWKSSKVASILKLEKNLQKLLAIV